MQNDKTQQQKPSEEVLRAAYNEIKQDNPQLDWQTFNGAFEHATTASGRGGGSSGSDEQRVSG